MTNPKSFSHYIISSYNNCKIVKPALKSTTEPYVNNLSHTCLSKS